MASDDGRSKILEDIYRKMERERSLIQGAKAMRMHTSNPDVRRRCDSSIAESLENIRYLQKRLEDVSANMRNETHSKKSADNSSSSSSHGDRSYDSSVNSRQYGNQNKAKKRPNTELDLLKADSEFLDQRIPLMIEQLAFKLSVEKQIKDGIEKLSNLYDRDKNDRRSRAQVTQQRAENTQKVQLLKMAYKRYMDLKIPLDNVEDDSTSNLPNIRRPLSGRLKITIVAVQNVDHQATHGHKASETMVAVKVEDSLKAQTRLSRQDQWNESFDLQVDKANEIEITVYDRNKDYNVPIGIMWMRLSDIAEEIRIMKNEAVSSGWVSADQTQDPGTNSVQSGVAQMGLDKTLRPQGSMEPEGEVEINSWFVLEPAGKINIRMSFQKSNVSKRPVEPGRLERTGAIRQRKEEIHEVLGHKFVQQQFYNVMRCAFCGEFLKYASGYQCEDCKYTCHKKCYQNVVTKCIAKSSSDVDPDEGTINHRIPHRFESITNIGANWCCHCGYMLPLGKKNARRCKECGLTCHADCMHLVPDFCGMSMETASKILIAMRESKETARRPQTAASSLKTSKTSDALQSRQSQDTMASTSTMDSTYSIPSVFKPPSSSSDEKTGTNTDSQTSSMSSQFSIQTTPSRVMSPELSSAGTPAGSGGKSASPYGLYPQSHNPYQMPKTNDTDVFGGAPRPPEHMVYPSASVRNKVPRKPVQNDVVPHPTEVRTQAGIQSSSAQHQLAAAAQSQPVVERPQEVAATVKPSLGYQQSPLTHTTVDKIAQPIQQKVSAPPQVKRKIGLDDFNFLAVLGKGNFGKVMLAETKSGKKLYAIKVLKKDYILQIDGVESTRSEKRVFLIANRERHPFLLNLQACFQTETRVYFVMQYISGGDLMWHIQKEPFTQKRAQFYAAEVCLGLKYFHESGVIYRDLKLDNILLTLDGHVKIADYGLCKENMGPDSTTQTFCGTPELMAPEIIRDLPYGLAVDWWAFGVLIYQMILGQSPFRGEDEQEIFEAILKDEPLYPIQMPRNSVMILQALLTREPTQRLGYGIRDAKDVMEHPYFENINWDDIYHKRVPPPFVPSISSETDTSNFDEEFTGEIPVLTPVTKVLPRADQERFRGFSYVHPDSL
ncbi:Phototropin-1 [Lipomyces oligophaga]|uniref:Phototropin-1 n=1 Tax=Lipomyces oligophaga TaxID=45792 RepID=UPI0034CEBAF9